MTFIPVSARRIGAAAAALGLIGCASGPDAIVQTVKSSYQRDQSLADRAQLNPDFRYLRVTLGGRVALLVLGYVDPDPLGPIEVWYSAEREALRLQHGRVVGATGMLTEWRGVRVSGAPDWSGLVGGGTGVTWVRTRDVMPGYRFGVKETLEVVSVPAPERSALRGLDPGQLAWFEERGADLPAARYALSAAGGRANVVYGEQCLAPQTCFTWQRWPAGSLGSE